MKRSTGAILGLAAVLVFGAACGSHRSDDAIANDIKARLFSDPDLKTTDIAVAVKDGAVTLTGDVPSAETELKAVKLVNDLAGVKKVDDQLKVQAADAAAQGQPPQEPAAPAAAPSAPPSAQPAARKPAQSKSAPASQPSPAVASPSNPPGVSAQAPPAPPPQPTTVTIPSGTPVAIRMIDSVDSAHNTTGQQFQASLNDAIRIDGQIVAPRGANVVVQLSNAKNAGRIRGQSELELQLVKMTIHGQDYNLVSDDYTAVGKARGKESATRVGIGAAAGAVIGALAGGGKGAGIGAAVGGGGATAYQVFTRGQQVKIPSETLLRFNLQAPVTVTVAPK